MREVLGPHGIGPRNANGERLLQFCIMNQLRVEHSFHPHSTSQKATWYHPRFGNPGIIDMALTKRVQARHCADVRVLPSVDTWSDHKLCRLKLVQVADMPWTERPKAISNGRPRRLPVDLAGSEFAAAVDEALREIRDMEDAQKIVRKVAEDKLPRPAMNRPHWQRDNSERLKQLSQRRQDAFAELQQSKTDIKRKQYREVCKQNRRAVRRMVAAWWDDRLRDMERAAEHGDSRALHDGVKRLLAFIAKEESSKKALSSDVDGELQGLTAHFRDILNINRTVDPAVLANAPDLSHFGKEVDWSEPSADDVRWGIRRLRSGRAPCRADAAE